MLYLVNTIDLGSGKETIKGIFRSEAKANEFKEQVFKLYSRNLLVTMREVESDLSAKSILEERF